MRLNRPLVGFLIGLVTPVLGFFIVFVLRRHGDTFDTFMSTMKSQPKYAAANVTLAVLANLFVFTYFTRRRLDYAARGVLSATILYFVAVIYLRFIA